MVRRTETRGKRRIRAMLAAVVLGIVAVGVWSTGAEPEGARRVEPAPSDHPALARWLVPDLVIGSRIAELEVTNLDTPMARDGSLAIELTGDSGKVILFVARKGTTEFLPPLSTDRYDLFVNEGRQLRGGDTSSNDLLELLAKQIRPREMSVPDEVHPSE